ncbi:MAG: hypothetical protein CVU56_22455 [Deltaproteobacteria bacterium HGW-Deltaproteobacteria-14]|jgi:ParB-like chromosome segregation protein Spo0J|nr:MAG: hypothetical protein CVU56_22455 [Deltaproteobacteria bacterium HGW-Deltaproteobacteria-14]
MEMISGYPVHPACAMLPMMPDAAITELAADIRRHGQQQPIWLHDGQILDGRNRLRACALAGVDPDVREWEGDDPVRWVLSLNFHRRHLSDTQKAVVGARAERLIAEREASARVAEREASDPEPTPPPEGEGVGEGDAPATAPPLRAADFKRARQAAAALVNVSERAIARGRQLLDKAVPGLVDAVERGDVGMSAAEAIAGLEPERQNALVAAGDDAVMAEVRRIQEDRRAARPPSVVAALDLLDAAFPSLSLAKASDGRWRFEGTTPDLPEPCVAYGRTAKEALGEACRELDRLDPS